MNFIVSSGKLSKELQQIVGIIGSNTVLPILEDFLFEVHGSELTVTATDLETSVKVRVPIETKEGGKVCIPAKILIDTLKNIPEQPLSIIVESNYEIVITSDNGKYKVMGEAPSNFPKDPEMEEGNSLTMLAKDLVTGISKTLFATSSDNLRPAMMGVFFELKDNQLVMVATDAHRLMKYTLQNVPSEFEHSLVVPKKPLTLLKSTLANKEDEIQLHFSKNHLFVKHSSLELSCRLIDARYPDYKVVIPTENPYTLLVNTNEFQNALKRLSIFSNKSTYQVVLSISGSSLEMSSQDIDLSFEGKERMNCQFDGEDMSIGFNAKLFIEMLSATDSEEIEIKLSSGRKAGVVYPATQKEGESLLMLVMPIMVN